MTTDHKSPEQIAHDLNLSFISPQEQKAIKTGLDLADPSIARNIFRDWLVRTIGGKNRELAALRTPDAVVNGTPFDKIAGLVAQVERTRIDVMGPYAEDMRGAPDELMKIHEAFSRIHAVLSDASAAAIVYEGAQAGPDVK